MQIIAGFFNKNKQLYCINQKKAVPLWAELNFTSNNYIENGQQEKSLHLR